MKTPRKDAELTRQEPLSAGSEVFAAKGYRDTTIAEVCERAGANNAAINYHFRDKETLYRESWHHAFLKSLESHPPDGGVGDGTPLEERLWGQVTALCIGPPIKITKNFPSWSTKSSPIPRNCSDRSCVTTSASFTKGHGRGPRALGGAVPGRGSAVLCTEHSGPVYERGSCRNNKRTCMG